MLKHGRFQRGFTLLELLTTITVFGVLMAVVLNAFSKTSRAGLRAKDQELVTELATSLNYLIQERKVWPAAILNGVEKGGGEGVVDANVAVGLANEGMMNMVTATDNQDVTHVVGRDRLGIVDGYAAAVIKRNKRATLDSIVPQGGTIKDHLVHYAIDIDDDGITEAKIAGRTVRVRGAAIAWACGADGKVEDTSRAGRSDDVFSWRNTQEVKE